MKPTESLPSPCGARLAWEEMVAREASERAPSEPAGQPRSLDVATCSVSRRPGDRGVWSIGDPLNPSRDDAMCGTEEAARRNAREMSGLDRIVAVWHGSDCIALYWEGQEWRRP